MEISEKLQANTSFLPHNFKHPHQPPVYTNISQSLQWPIFLELLPNNHTSGEKHWLKWKKASKKWKEGMTCCSLLFQRPWEQLCHPLFCYLTTLSHSTSQAWHSHKHTHKHKQVTPLECLYSWIHTETGAKSKDYKWPGNAASVFMTWIWCNGQTLDWNCSYFIASWKSSCGYSDILCFDWRYIYSRIFSRHAIIRHS